MSGLFGVTGPAVYRWPTKMPIDVSDYAFDFYGEMTDLDTITSVALDISPSGEGELQASSLSITRNVLTVWLSEGVAGRAYTVRLVVNTDAGRTFGTLISIGIDATFAPYPSVPPPSTDFGPVLTAVP